MGVTATDTETGTEAEEATETDMPALVEEETMIMGLDQAATTAAMTVGGAMTTLDLLVGIGMMDHPEETVAEEGEAAVVVVVVEREWEHLNVGLRPQKVHSHCRRGNGKLLDGMSMLLGMNNTLLCKQSKLVRIHTTYFLDRAHAIASLGLFNLPGANRTQIPPILGIAGLPPPMPVQTFGMGIGSNPNLSRQSRRLYIGSITPDVNEQNLADFFNTKMIEMNIGTGGPGNPVLAVQCNYEKNYAFVEVSQLDIPALNGVLINLQFRSAEDATAAMAFDGIIFINGPLKIRRPKDYGGGVEMGSPGVHVPGVVSTNVPDSINKVFVGGLPTYLNEENVMELLKSFGELKAFNLVRENGTGASKVSIIMYQSHSFLMFLPGLCVL